VNEAGTKRRGPSKKDTLGDGGRMNGSDSSPGERSPPDRRTLSRAKRFVSDTKKLYKKNTSKLTEEDREKLDAAIAGVEAAIEGSDDAKRLSTTIKELDARVDQILGFAKKSTAREYAESIAIAILIAVVLRAFVVEAFKIPTGSMIPTLAVGDHIFVNKFIYGLRIPLTNSWFAEWGSPQHGDVIVFRYPRDLSKDYIKRVVAVAGDHVRVDGEDVFVNAKKLERQQATSFSYVDEGEEEDQASFGVERRVLAYPETSTGDHPRQYTVIYKPVEPSRLALPSGGPLPGLDCTYDRPESPGECVVQPGYVFVMGDNRDNSSDSRVWGCVPTSYVKGKAMFVWWSRGPKSGVRWNRIGSVVN
jgi:signal peptidase I